jgi:hypothetical protein
MNRSTTTTTTTADTACLKGTWCRRVSPKHCAAGDCEPPTQGARTVSVTPLKGRTKLQAKTRVLLDWLEHQPPFTDDQGRATTRAYEAAKAAGVYSGAQTGFANVLANLEARELITRDINGKRCYRIATTTTRTEAGQVIEWQAPPGYEQPSTCCRLATVDGVIVDHEHRADDELPPDIEAVVDAAIEAVEPYLDRELPERRPALVATVHLSLDVDPATARLVLDLVEGSEAVVPVDRADVQRLIAYAIDKAAERMTGAADRRLSAIEEQLGQLSAGMRSLDASSVTNGTTNGAPVERIPRPSTAELGRRYGVKNSASRQLLADLVVDGWELTKANDSHVRVSKPGHKPFNISSTPGDKRTPLNDRSRARSNGANV